MCTWAALRTILLPTWVVGDRFRPTFGALGTLLTLVGHGGSSMEVFNAAKVFSATKAREREDLGEVITRWIRANPQVQIVEKVVTQSSDNEFHCLTITVFYRE